MAPNKLLILNSIWSLFVFVLKEIVQKYINLAYLNSGYTTKRLIFAQVTKAYKPKKQQVNDGNLSLIM